MQYSVHQTERVLISSFSFLFKSKTFETQIQILALALILLLCGFHVVTIFRISDHF